MRQNEKDWTAIKTCSLFAGLEEETLRALLPGGGEPAATFEKGEVLYSPETFERALAVILSGSALVSRDAGDGRRVPMSVLRAGSVFGMAALFYEAPTYPTEIRAESPCRALFLSKAWLEAAFIQAPRLCRNYIALLSERIHFLSRRLEAYAGDTPREKLLRYLQGLTPGEGGLLTLDFPMGRLADALGVGRATLYRALEALEAEGILRHEGRRIVLTNPGCE